MKQCNECHKSFPIETFPKRKNSKGHLVPRGYCSECNRKKALAAYHNRKNDPDYKKRQTNHVFRKRLKEMGITEDEFEDHGDRHNWECQICHKVVIEKPYADHDHITNKFRGILCFHCNVGIGHFFDSIELLKSAITYLSGQNQQSP